MQVAFAGLAIALSTFVGVAAAGRAPRAALLGLLALAGASILLSLTPKVVFLAWFGVAPLLQESASKHSALGHTLGLALYVAPPLVFAIWTLTRRSHEIRPRFVDVLPCAYFLYTLVWVVAAGEASSTIIKGVYVTVGIGVVLYYFFAFGPIGSLSVASVAAVVLVVTIVEGVMGIVDGATGWNLWNDTGWQFGHARAVATLANPAVLGTLLGMGIVLAVAILVWSGPARLRMLAAAAIVFGFPGLYFALTRTPIIGTLAAVILVLMTRTKTRLLAVAVCVVAGVVVTASWGRITASTLYRERVTNSANVQARILVQDWSLKLAAERPVFGSGYGSFDRVKNESNFSSGTTPRSFGTISTSHNTYLTILVELGSVGLALFVIPWLLIPWRAVRSALREPQSTWFAVGAVGALLVFVGAANANDFKYFSFLPAIPWLLLGLLRRRQLTEV
jgi:O-antigen ligase